MVAPLTPACLHRVYVCRKLSISFILLPALSTPSGAWRHARADRRRSAHVGRGAQVCLSLLPRPPAPSGLPCVREITHSHHYSSEDVAHDLCKRRWMCMYWLPWLVQRDHPVISKRAVCISKPDRSHSSSRLEEQLPSNRGATVHPETEVSRRNGAEVRATLVLLVCPRLCAGVLLVTVLCRTPPSCPLQATAVRMCVPRACRTLTTGAFPSASVASTSG